MPEINGYVSGVVYLWKPATAQWIKLRGASIWANGVLKATTNYLGQYTFPVVGGTVINPLMSRKTGYLDAYYPGVPFTVVANVTMRGYDLYMSP
jgi:hypothetical protein